MISYSWTNISPQNVLFSFGDLSYLTRALERGGQILPSPHVFCQYLSKYSFDRRDFFSTCPKINGAPFGAKIEDSSILGGLFLSPQSQHFRFSPSWCHDGGVLAPLRPPPPHRLAGPALRRPVARGGGGRALGGAGRALGGGEGGARSRSRIAGSGGRASLCPATTGRVGDGGGPMKTNEGPGSIYLHVRHITLIIKMRVCKYYYFNYVLE